MNDDDIPGSHYYLEQAQKALRQRDKSTTRYWAELAAQSNQELEEPWLILAAISDPTDSIHYLKRALEVNPKSQRARKGMHWAIQRQRAAAAAVQAAPVLAETAPLRVRRSSSGLDETAPVKIRSKRLKPRQRIAWLLALLPAAAILLLLVISVVFLSGLRPRWTVFAGSSSAPRPVGVLFKPSLTPTFTFTPTITNTPTATATATSTPTFTPTATFTNTPSLTPSDTPEPTATELPAAVPSGTGYSGRWIDVDLTNQMVYALEGDEIVNSFLVSTGTWRTPTVTGQYQIYVKYTAADMAGPGYYLPSVPYVMYFYRGYGFHGTYWHNNFGTPMSHGCINLRTSDAEWLFHWASVGTLVNIRY
jgi:lipoprotein-anchoring transpeptidase ErfK/SrfK